MRGGERRLLVLRRGLLEADGEGRVVVGEEVDLDGHRAWTERSAAEADDAGNDDAALHPPPATSICIMHFPT